MANTTNNNSAAQTTESIMNKGKVKAAIATLAKKGSAGFQAFLDKIHNLNSMKDDEVRDEVHSAFASAKEQLESEVAFMNKFPAFSTGYNVQDFEEAARTFLEIEKEIQSIQDITKLRKVALMFWNGLKFIVGFILKSAVKAAEFIAVYGIRIIAIGTDFIIRLVKKAVKFAKTTWTVIKAVRISKEGKETPQTE